jgi:hypothetical protein
MSSLFVTRSPVPVPSAVPAVAAPGASSGTPRSSTCAPARGGAEDHP